MYARNSYSFIVSWAICMCASGGPHSAGFTICGAEWLSTLSRKAWDDRVGCAVVIEVMRRLVAEGHPNILIVAATTQEETGVRGAHTAADVVHPDIGIAIEGGVAGDVPGAHPEETQARLGAGPGIFLYDFSEQPNRRLVSLIKETGKTEKIPNAV